MKQILIVALLILLMSSIVSAEVVENLPYDTRNLPLDNSYAFFDFEDGTGHFDPIPTSQHNGTVEFITVFDNNRDHIWSYNDREFNLMHVYPKNVFYQDDGVTPVNYTYLINGQYAASTVVELYPGGYYTGVYGLINIPDGANHVSFLVSSGDYFKVTAYDKKGNQIGYTSVPTTIYRVSLPNGPSTWSLVYFNTTNPDIYSIEIRGQCNDWLIDDLVIGGLTQADQPTDYSWAAERLKLLIGAPHNPNGFGIELQSGAFYPAEDIINNPLVVNWDSKNKEWVTGEGINNPAAIIWALNKDSNLINNLCINDMASKDFKEFVEYGEQRPGDVAFIEYDITSTVDSELGYDEMIMFIEPQYDPDTGAYEDCIRIQEEGGVHYIDSGYLHGLYGADYGIEIISLFTVKRLPDAPKGNKSPYPKIPGKFKI